MGSINTGRVVMGGLLAGVIVFVSTAARVLVLREQIVGFIGNHGLQGIGQTEGIVFLAVYSAALGILIVWLYAVIRPRFGAGTTTAIIGGLFYWISIYLVPYAALLRFDLIPIGGVLVHWIWTVAEIPVASLVGAWVYQEE
jgi:hypothetical protein